VRWRRAEHRGAAATQGAREGRVRPENGDPTQPCPVERQQGCAVDGSVADQDESGCRACPQLGRNGVVLPRVRLRDRWFDPLEGADAGGEPQ
jgi:hypothetical protein